MPNIQNIQKVIVENKINYERLHNDLLCLKKKNKIYEKNKQQYEIVRKIIHIVAQATQKEASINITKLIDAALKSVFGDKAYKPIIQFPVKNNRTGCSILFERIDSKGNKRLIIPKKQGAGYGAVDVAGLALRIAVWALQPHKTRGVIILDEPLRSLSKGFRGDAGNMLKEISKGRLQIIMATHSKKLAECADKVFYIKLINGISKIKRKGEN